MNVRFVLENGHSDRVQARAFTPREVAGDVASLAILLNLSRETFVFRGTITFVCVFSFTGLVLSEDRALQLQHLKLLSSMCASD